MRFPVRIGASDLLDTILCHLTLRHQHSCIRVDLRDRYTYLVHEFIFTNGEVHGAGKVTLDVASTISSRHDINCSQEASEEQLSEVGSHGRDGN